MLMTKENHNPFYCKWKHVISLVLTKYKIIDVNLSIEGIFTSINQQIYCAYFLNKWTNLFSCVEGIGRRKNVVSIHSRLLVETMPYHTRNVKEKSLSNKDERYPLVIRNHGASLIFLRYIFIIWQVVCVPHPAVTIGVFCV